MVKRTASYLTVALTVAFSATTWFVCRSLFTGSEEKHIQTKNDIPFPSEPHASDDLRPTSKAMSTCPMAILGFSFGMGVEKTPGLSNEALGVHVVDVIQSGEREGCTRPLVMLQWEIANVVQRLGISTDYEAHPTGGYLGTAGVLKQFSKYIKERNPSARRPIPVYLVVHRDHFPRCRALLAERSVFKPLNSRESVPDVYDPNSTQKWTRNKQAFAQHEKALGFQDKVDDHLAQESPETLVVADVINAYMDARSVTHMAPVLDLIFQLVKHPNCNTQVLDLNFLGLGESNEEDHFVLRMLSRATSIKVVDIRRGNAMFHTSIDKLLMMEEEAAKCASLEYVLLNADAMGKELWQSIQARKATRKLYRVNPYPMATDWWYHKQMWFKRQARAQASLDVFKKQKIPEADIFKHFFEEPNPALEKFVEKYKTMMKHQKEKVDELLAALDHVSQKPEDFAELFNWADDIIPPDYRDYICDFPYIEMKLSVDINSKPKDVERINKAACVIRLIIGRMCGISEGQLGDNNSFKKVIVLDEFSRLVMERARYFVAAMVPEEANEVLLHERVQYDHIFDDSRRDDIMRRADKFGDRARKTRLLAAIDTLRAQANANRGKEVGEVEYVSRPKRQRDTEIHNGKVKKSGVSY